MALAVAVAIWQGDDVFLVQRPHRPDEEFPGLWGLPAATLRPQEDLKEAVCRLGRDKLGLELQVEEVLARGEQLRGQDILRMFLFSARYLTWPPRLASQGEEGVTYYLGWTWGQPRLLVPAALMGSLCSRLLLDYLGLPWA